MNKNRLVFVLCLGIVLFLYSFVENDIAAPPKDKFVVVLDAGHGGHDPGNLGNGYLEKNIALSIVLQAGKILEQDPNVKVIYTRKDDTFVDLFVRGEIANQANADLFVSVHCDSHFSDAHGAGTFVLGLHANKQNFEVAKKENSVIYLEDNYEQKYAEYDINSPESVIGLTIMQEEFLDQSIELAKLMQDNFTKKLKRKDRKVKQAGFIVLHQTFMPSVLVETGFLTNKNEGTYLNSEKGKKDMGTAIANAILKFKDGVEANLPPMETIEDDPIQKAVDKVVENTKTPEVKTKEEVETPKVKEVASVETPKINTEEATKVEKKDPPSDLTFKVQLLASSKSIPLQPKNFKGLPDLSSEPINNMFRYMYGSASSYQDAQKLRAVAIAKGYSTAYIVVYKAGKRIPLTDDLK